MALVLLAVAWLATIATIALWAMPPWFGPALLLCFVPLAWLIRGRKWAITLAAMAGVALVGGVRFSAWQQRYPPSLSAYVGQQVTLHGVVDSEPQPAATTTAFVVDVEDALVGTGEAAVDGKVRVSFPQYTAYLPGTKLTLSGTLEDPPVFPDFDYRSYLGRQGIVATMFLPTTEVTAEAPRWGVARNITEARLALDRSLQRSLPEPEASLAGGIAFGRDGNLPDDLYSDFRDTGLAHIVAVSGSNVSLVAALTFALFTWLIGRRFAILPGALTVAGYLLVAGLSASVTRAGVMAMVFLLGSFLGRQRSALSALGAAAMVMTLYQPSAALDIGFQLSLAATAGLIAFGPWLRLWFAAAARHMRMMWLPAIAIDVASLSASATIATLPLVWVNFGRISLIGPFANILIEPLFVFAFWLSALTAAAGVLWHPAGWAAGLMAYYPLSFMTWFARTAANLPFAAVDVPDINGSTAAAAYALMGGVGWLAYRRYAPTTPRPAATPLHARVRRPVLAFAGAGLAACVILPVSLLPARGPGEMVVDILPVADGDAILVTTPSGHHVLIDGGPSATALAEQLGAVLPHWDRAIEAVIGLGDTPQQTGAWPGTVARFHVLTAPSPAAAAPVDFNVDGVTIQSVGLVTSAGQQTLRITYRGMSVLLPGGLSAGDERALIASADVRSTALVVPHNGASQGDIPLIRSVAPALAVIPVAVGGFARPPLDDVIAAAGPGPVLRSDRDGRIRLRIDGQRIEFETER